MERGADERALGGAENAYSSARTAYFEHASDAYVEHAYSKASTLTLLVDCSACEEKGDGAMRYGDAREQEATWTVQS